MTERIQEFVDSRNEPLRLDRERGVLRGVKLLGLESRNGRQYRERALAEAVALYEGAKVNVNHPKPMPHAPRDYQDRLGAIRDVCLRPGAGLFGDLHFNPKHALAEQLAWDAEHAPGQVGLSHNVLARTVREGGQLVVEAITKVESVDLVADPATTRGLFEQTEVTTASERALAELTLEALTAARPDLIDQIAAPLHEAIDCERRQARILRLLAHHGLPLPGSDIAAERRITSDAFLATLTEATSDQLLVERIADRAAVVREAAPPRSPATLSREQRTASDAGLPPALASGKALAAALRVR